MTKAAKKTQMTTSPMIAVQEPQLPVVAEPSGEDVVAVDVPEKHTRIGKMTVIVKAESGMTQGKDRWFERTKLTGWSKSKGVVTIKAPRAYLTGKLPV